MALGEHPGNIYLKTVVEHLEAVYYLQSCMSGPELYSFLKLVYN